MNIEAEKSVAAVKTVERTSKLEYMTVNIICLLLFLTFGYIALMSFFQTTVFDSSDYLGELMFFQADDIVLNLFFTALFIFFLFRIKGHYDFFARVNLRVMEIGLAVYTILLGLTWIYSVTSLPDSDSLNIFETASLAANDIYTPFHNGAEFMNKEFYSGYSYFNFYPFQLGFVMLCEIIYRIFGTQSTMPVQVLNVICLGLSYFALARISKLLFQKRSIEFVTILLLAVCFQPVLFCTFAYGNIIGMTCAIWASMALIKYFQTNKYLWLAPCGVLLILSTLIKYNNMIYLISFVVMLVIYAVKKKKWQSVAFALAVCVAVAGAGKLVVMSYEKRADVKLYDGVSQVLYLDMGMQDSYMAPGWYTRVGLETYLYSNFDTKTANAEAWQDIKTRLNAFSDNPAYAFDFYSKKIMSQWNEPTFESVWISEVKEHASEPNGLARSVYDGSLGQLLELHFNFYLQIVYILFSIGAYLMFVNRRANIETALLPLVILGGFGYHLLFEAKSQYALTYIPLMLPFAAYAVITALEGNYTKLKSAAAKINAVSKKRQKENNTKY